MPPEYRGLREPVLGPPGDYRRILLTMLSRPNICSKEWIVRQYDHEVQGTSVIKHLVGVERDVPNDAVVLRPRLDSLRGLATAQALNPTYSRIDAYHMAACTIDEAVRRLLAVGGSLEHLGGVDNFQYHPESNPDGKLKAAQLVRANWALRDYCLGFGIPLLSGKDSMYVDGNLEGYFGERHKVSGLETLQFTSTSVIEDVQRCVTMDAKMEGDLLYALGFTRNELAGSFRVNPRVLRFMRIYRTQGAAGEACRGTTSVPGFRGRYWCRTGCLSPWHLPRRSRSPFGLGGYGWRAWFGSGTGQDSRGGSQTG